MGFFDRSSSSSTTQNFTEVVTPTSGAQDGSLSIAAAGDINYSSLDAGAIGGALDLAGGSVAAVSEFAGASLDQLGASLSAALESAFSFASESLGVVERVSSDALDFQNDALETSIAAVGSVAEESQFLVGEAQSGGAQRLLYFGAAALVALIILAKVVK
jgi:hypothetical protein